MKNIKNLLLSKRAPGVRPALLVLVMAATLTLFSATAAAQVTSVLWGVNGEAWDPETSILNDYSDVGYMGGNVAIPTNWPVGVNVLDYGAVPNDEISDLQAFRDAIADCPPFHAIYVPTGTYWITDWIKVSDQNNFVLRGEDMYDTVLYFPTNMSILHPTEEQDDPSKWRYSVIAPPAVLWFQNGTNMNIETLSVEFSEDPMGDHFNTDGRPAIKYDGVEDSWIRNVYIKNANDGIILGARRITVMNIVMDQYAGRPSGGENTVGHHGLVVRGARNCLFHNCFITGMWQHDLISADKDIHNVYSRIRMIDGQIDHHAMGADPRDNLWTDIDCGEGLRIWEQGGNVSGNDDTIWNVYETQGTGNTNRMFTPDPVRRNVVVGLENDDPTSIGANWHHEAVNPYELTPQNIYLAQLEKKGKPIPGPLIDFDIRPVNPWVVIASDDTYIDENTGNNFSWSENYPCRRAFKMRIKRGNVADQKPFMKFDFRDSQFTSVHSATLSVVCVAANNSTEVGAYGYSNDSWTEDTISGVNKPAGTSTLLASASVSTERGKYEWDVTDFVNEALAGDGDRVVTIYLTDINKTDAVMDWKTHEGGGAPDLKPMITLTADGMPPKAPTGLAGSPGDGQVSLDWDDNTESNVTYSVYRSTTSGSYSGTLTNGLTSSETVDSTATNGTMYYYRVTATTNSLESVRSSEVFVIPAAAGNQPPAFTSDPVIEANALQNTAYSQTLADNANDPESDPVIFSKISGPNWLSVAADGGLSGTPVLADTGLNTFTVRIDAAGGSDMAALEITVDPDTTAPAVPTGLTAIATNGLVQLNWAGNTEDDLASYSLYRSTTAGGYSDPLVTGLTETGYIDTDVEGNLTYYYAVTATDLYGNESETGGEASASPALLSFTFVSASENGNFSGESNLDVSEKLQIRNKFGTGDSDAYLRFEIDAANDTIGGVVLNDIIGVTLNLAVDDTRYQVSVYALDDLANPGAGFLTETSWTEYNLKESIAPHGYETIQNASLATSLGSASDSGMTAGDNFWINLDVTEFKNLITQSSNNEITLIISGAKDWNGYVASLDNTHSYSVPTLQIIGVPPPDTTPPAIPTGLGVTAGDGSVSLDWADNAEIDLDGYSVYRSTTSGSYGSALASNLSASAYVDSTAVNGTTYYYAVSATDIHTNESARSAEVSATPQALSVPPAAPSSLTAIPGNGSVRLDWADNIEGDLAGYSVYRATSPGEYGGYSTTLLVSNLTRSDFEDTSVVNGTTYYYVVTAMDFSDNESDPCDEVSVMPSASIGAPEWVISFGSGFDGLGGFTQSTPATPNQFWFNQTSSVQYRNQDPDNRNSSLLRKVVLDRTPDSGMKYTLTGSFVITDGYADDNNRVGLYLFGDSAKIPSESEAGAIGLIWNYDAPAGGNDPNDAISLRVGIDGGSLSADSPRDLSGYDVPTELWNTTVQLSADVWFEGTNVLVQGFLTDEQGHVTETAVATNAAADFTGDYFGFVSRTRARNYPNLLDPKGAPTVIEYQSFTVSPYLTPVSGLSVLPGDNSVLLDWADIAADDWESYNVYRATASGGYSTTPLASGLTDSSYVDTTAVNDTTYYYEVTAVYTLGDESVSSGEVSATPTAPDGIPMIVDFGTDNDGLGGFVQSAPDGADVSWSTQTSSAQYRNQDGSAQNSSFLREVVLDRTAGRTYNISGTIQWSNGYADDYNRLGILMFAATNSVLYEDEPGNLGVVWIVDDGSSAGAPGDNTKDDLSVYLGGYNSNAAETTLRNQTIPYAQDLVGTEVTLSAQIAFVGTDIIITASMTDAGGTTTIATPVVAPAADYAGNYFGFVTRTRARYYTEGESGSATGRSLPWVMDYKNFSITTGGEPPVVGPAAPADLAATPGDGSVALDWSDNTEDDLAGYSVYRATSSAGYDTNALVTGLNDSSYVDTTAVNGTTYYYVVKAFNTNGAESALSDEVSATPEALTEPPEAPVRLQVTPGSGSVRLDWLDNTESDLAGYSVYRATASGGYSTAPLAGGLTRSDFVDTNVVNETTYYYVVTAVDTSGSESDPGNEASATPSAAFDVPEWVITFGSELDGLGGFTQSAPATGNMFWFGQTNSIQFRNQDPDNRNSSLLRNVNLDRTPGSGIKYTLTGSFVITDSYADDNNRVGLYLFGDSAKILSESEAGAIGLIWNYDAPSGGNNPKDEIALIVGIDGGGLTAGTPRDLTSYDVPTELWNTTVQLSADVWFEGTSVLVQGFLTDEQGNVTQTAVATNAAADYAGDYFGFVSRTRARNYPNLQDPKGAPTVIDYKSFTVSPYVTPVSGLSALPGDHSVSLDWADHAAEGRESYSVYRATTSGGYSTTPLASGLTDSTYVDTTAINGTTYYYAVTAVYTGGDESVPNDEVSATPTAPDGLPVVIDFGTDNDGLGGFTQSASADTEVSWSTQTNSVKYTNINPQYANSSFLKPVILDRTPGKTYTISGTIQWSNGYADQYNRMGILMFAPTNSVLNEDSAGNIGVVWIVDDGSELGAPGDNTKDEISIYSGGYNANSVETVLRNQTIPYAQDLVGTEITLTAQVKFEGSDIVITASMTDAGGTTTIATPVVLPAADYTGNYFGFVTRARSKNYTGGTGSAAELSLPWVMDYKNFSITAGEEPPTEGYGRWATDHGVGAGSADDDSDGLNNLYEYAMGGNPTNPAAHGTLPVFSKSGNRLLYIHPKRSDDASLTYTVDTRTNLVVGSWTTHGYVVTGTNVTGETIDFVTNDVDTVESETFIRLRIE